MQVDENETLGGYLRKLRIQHKDTLDSLASKLGCTKSSVSAYELDKFLPSVKKLLKLMEYYSLTEDQKKTVRLLKVRSIVSQSKPLIPPIAILLRTLRVYYDENCRDMCRRLSINGSGLSALEHGHRALTEKQIKILQDYYHVTQDELNIINNSIITKTERTIMKDQITKWCDQLKNTLIAKNQNYGGSAFQTPVLLTDLPAERAIAVRMSDKIARLKSLFQGEPDKVGESIKDTLLDLAGYCMLEIIALENKEKE